MLTPIISYIYRMTKKCFCFTLLHIKTILTLDLMLQPTYSWSFLYCPLNSAAIDIYQWHGTGCSVLFLNDLLFLQAPLLYSADLKWGSEKVCAVPLCVQCGGVTVFAGTIMAFFIMTSKHLRDIETNAGPPPSFPRGSDGIIFCTLTAWQDLIWGLWARIVTWVGRRRNNLFDPCFGLQSLHLLSLIALSALLLLFRAGIL